MKKATTAPPDHVRALQRLFEDQVPFNRVLGLRIDGLESGAPTIRFDMRPELIGNARRQVLHGGVISATLDVTAGLVVFAEVLKRSEGLPLDANGEPAMPNIGTIDLRVDYLRPGRGKWFVASGKVVRAGSRIAVAHVQLENDAGELIATGSAAYVVS